MSWIEIVFKGKTAWARVDSGGTLVSAGGRTPMRYSKAEGAKIYRGGTSRIEPVAGATPQSLPEGVSADAAAKGGSKGRKKKGSGFGSAKTRTAAQAAAARADARERIDALPEGTHIAFTDGACKGNPGPAGSGAVLKLADGTVLESSKRLGISTNNVGELTAIGLVMDMLEEAGIDNAAPVALFTDSDYASGVLVRGWKAKANTELIMGLRKRLKSWPNLEIAWVAGHAGIPENERADALASAAAVR